MQTVTGTMTIVQLGNRTNDSGEHYYTVTTRDDATGDREVIGLTRVEYDELFQRLYRQRGVVLSSPEQKGIWNVGYISGLAREHAASILPAVMSNRAIEWNDVFPPRMP